MKPFGTEVSLHDNVTAPSGVTLHYDPATQRINQQFSSICLTPGNPAFMKDACQDVPSQRWTLGTDGRIVSMSDGKWSGMCLTADRGSVINGIFTWPCDSPPSSRQQWTFHPQVRDPASTLYLLCANENQTCSFTGTLEVRYGANGSFTYRLLSGGTGCNNDVFTDPLWGVSKLCFFR